jgi:FixJ family two-component response regulator
MNSYVAVVEDDESVRRSFARLLRTVGFQPVTYGSAEDFLSDGKQPSFDCLILDVQLPGLSGLELAAKLAESGHREPFFFLTARNDESERDQAAALGCSGYFLKTDAGSEIIEHIGRVAFPNNPAREGQPNLPEGAVDSKQQNRE